eukprot:g16767.t1
MVNTHSYLLSAAAVSAALVVGAEGFLGNAPRLSTTATKPTGRRCRAPRLALTPPGKPGNGAGAGSAAAGGEEGGNTASNSGITRAPLRITPNFQPQEKRRPKTDVHRDVAYGAFLTEKSFDIPSMAWEEFSDFLRRTIERNVNGAQFEFDIRQWSSSIRKWCSRAVEMDVQAKADLFRLYESSVGQRDAWGNQASKVDSTVEDEWDSIYVDCQESANVGLQEFSFDGGGDLIGGSFGSTAANGGAEGSATGRDAGAATPSSQGEAGRWRASRSSISGSNAGAIYRTGGSRSALMAAMDAYQAKEGGEEGDEEEREDEDEDGEESGEEGEGGGEGKGFDEEDIIDCAIRGRWTFKNNDEPHFSPQ